MRRHDSALIAIMVAAALASTFVQVAIAKQTSSSSSSILPDSNIFLTYKDPNGDFNVKYPSNWIKSNSRPSDAVFDSSRVKVGEPIKVVRIEISVKNADQYLDEKQMILKDKTAYDYINDILEEAGYHPESDTTIRPIRVNNTTVAGINAWYIDYMFTPGYDDLFFRKTFMVHNGKLYKFDYLAPPLKVPATLPIAQKMIDSFELSK